MALFAAENPRCNLPQCARKLRVAAVSTHSLDRQSDELGGLIGRRICQGPRCWHVLQVLGPGEREWQLVRRRIGNKSTVTWHGRRFAPVGPPMSILPDISICAVQHWHIPCHAELSISFAICSPAAAQVTSWPVHLQIAVLCFAIRVAVFVHFGGLRTTGQLEKGGMAPTEPWAEMHAAAEASAVCGQGARSMPSKRG